MSLLNDIRLISLPKILDDRGNLSFFENDQQIPFAIKRIYWIYDVPGGEIRGGHAFLEQKEVIVALSGSFDLVFKTKDGESRYTLNRSYYGIYVPQKVWRHMENFSTNAVALVVSSTEFDEADYVRDYDLYYKMQ